MVDHNCWPGQEHWPQPKNTQENKQKTQSVGRAIDGEGEAVNWFLYLLEQVEQVQDPGKRNKRIQSARTRPDNYEIRGKENLQKTQISTETKINLWGEHAPKTLQQRRLTAKRPISKACPSNRHLKGYVARQPKDNAWPQHMRKG